MTKRTGVITFKSALLGVFADRQAGRAGIKACRPCRPIGKNICEQMCLPHLRWFDGLDSANLSAKRDAGLAPGMIS